MWRNTATMSRRSFYFQLEAKPWGLRQPPRDTVFPVLSGTSCPHLPEGSGAWRKIITFNPTATWHSIFFLHFIRIPSGCGGAEAASFYQLPAFKRTGKAVHCVNFCSILATERKCWFSIKPPTASQKKPLFSYAVALKWSPKTEHKFYGFWFPGCLWWGVNTSTWCIKGFLKHGIQYKSVVMCNVWSVVPSPAAVSPALVGKGHSQAPIQNQKFWGWAQESMD